MQQTQYVKKILDDLVHMQIQTLHVRTLDFTDNKFNLENKIMFKTFSIHLTSDGTISRCIVD